MVGFPTLLYKELLRFWKVGVQTVAAPVLTALLYLLVFAHALEGRMQVYDGVGYSAFLVPGLVMMSVLQNSFANSSSSLIQSKITGNLIFVLLTPISHVEFFCAYVLAAIARGLTVGLSVLAVTAWFVKLPLASPLWIVAFALAAFQNFIILPLTFLSGVFYSIHSLPAFWQGLSHLNPFFYMIDGFRYGFFGTSDFPPQASLAVVGVSLLALSAAALGMLKSGYKLRG
jgi:ABC-2 type transport system permease protein